MHFIGQQSMIFGVIVEGIEEVCGGRAQRAVGISLERSDTKKGSPEGVPDAIRANAEVQRAYLGTVADG